MGCYPQPHLLIYTNVYSEEGFFKPDKAVYSEERLSSASVGLCTLFARFISELGQLKKNLIFLMVHKQKDYLHPDLVIYTTVYSEEAFSSQDSSFSQLCTARKAISSQTPYLHHCVQL